MSEPTLGRLVMAFVSMIVMGIGLSMIMVGALMMLSTLGLIKV